MSHTAPILIDRNNKTVAYYSDATPKNLVIFVHGFLGKTTGAWDEFPDLIHDNPEFKYSDVIFYGYNSRRQANRNAEKFKDFLYKHTKDNTSFRNNATRVVLGRNFEYKNILLVAHSLGAIVVRRSLLRIKDERNSHPILNRTRMVLFAPAHMGTLIRDSFINALPGLLKVVGIVGLLAMPVVRNLQPESRTITDLISDTQHYRNIQEGDFTVAKTVIWADWDWVVVQDYFDDKENPEMPEGTDHSSVCKPIISSYLAPIKYVTDQLV